MTTMRRAVLGFTACFSLFAGTPARAADWSQLTESEHAALQESITAFIALRAGRQSLFERCTDGGEWPNAGQVKAEDRGSAFRHLVQRHALRVDVLWYEATWKEARARDVPCARDAWDGFHEELEAIEGFFSYLAGETDRRKARGGTAAFDAATALARLGEIARSAPLDLINADFDDDGVVRWAMHRRFAAVDFTNCVVLFRGAQLVDSRGVGKVAEHFGADLRQVDGIWSEGGEVHLHGTWFAPREEARFVLRTPDERVDFVLALETLRAGCRPSPSGAAD